MKPRVLAKRKEVINKERKKLAAFLLLAIVFAATNCEHRNTISSNENSKLDITWQQTALDSSSINYMATSPDGSILAGARGIGIVGLTECGDSASVVDRRLGNYLAVAKNGWIFVGFGGVVLRSKDNGDSWAQTALHVPSIYTMAINAQGYIVAGSGGYDAEPEGIFYSTDDGQTWFQANEGLESINILSLAFDTSGCLYADTAGSGVFRTFISVSQ